MSVATDILRARANEALAALVDCEDNAPWDADYCRRAIVENEALAELLDAHNRLERAIAGEADRG